MKQKRKENEEADEKRKERETEEKQEQLLISNDKNRLFDNTKSKFFQFLLTRHEIYQSYKFRFFL